MPLTQREQLDSVREHEQRELDCGPPPENTLQDVAAPVARRQSPSKKLPDGTGKEMVQTTCGKQCHGIDLVTSYQLSRSGRKTMVARVAIVPDENMEVVVDYLSTHLGR